MWETLYNIIFIYSIVKNQKNYDIFLKNILQNKYIMCYNISELNQWGFKTAQAVLGPFFVFREVIYMAMSGTLDTYLETVYTLSEESGFVRTTDISNHLNMFS